MIPIHSSFYVFYILCIYCLSQDEDLAMIAAQQYYIDYGSDMILDRLQSLLPSYIPDTSLIGGKSINYWIQGVLAAFKKSYFVRERVQALNVKEDIANYAKYKWPLLFSRYVQMVHTGNLPRIYAVSFGIVPRIYAENNVIS